MTTPNDTTSDTTSDTIRELLESLQSIAADALLKHGNKGIDAMLRDLARVVADHGDDAAILDDPKFVGELISQMYAMPKMSRGHLVTELVVAGIRLYKAEHPAVPE